MNIIENIIGFLMGLIVAVIVIAVVGWVLYIVLSNGSYYGGLLGDMVSGAIDFFKSFFTHATG